MKSVDIGRNSRGEGDSLAFGMIARTDVEGRKRGEQPGLDTLLVHAVNDVCSLSVRLLGAHGRLS